MVPEAGAVGRMFPILGANAFVPWDFVQPHEAWALKNHDQTVKRLAERGGLSWCELCAVLEHRRWQAMDVQGDYPKKAVGRVVNHLVAWYEARTPLLQERTAPTSSLAEPLQGAHAPTTPTPKD